MDSVGTVICRYINDNDRELVDIVIKLKSSNDFETITTSKHDNINVGDKIKLYDNKEFEILI